eukprot:3891621-Pyramimonas_sp.AAC.1
MFVIIVTNIISQWDCGPIGERLGARQDIDLLRASFGSQRGRYSMMVPGRELGGPGWRLHD